MEPVVSSETADAGDSIWIDLGFPVQTAPAGSSYKPLAAMRCVDLDGRLNVNVHGETTGENQNDLQLPLAEPNDSSSE